MNHRLPLFNWSLKKLLETEGDNFKKARILILFTVIIFSILKLIIAITAGYLNGQELQLARSVMLMCVFIVLLKMLLAGTKYTGGVGVVMIWMALFLTWTNVFVTAQNINIITIQVVMMVILCSFYLMHWTWGIIYSLLSSAPVIMVLFMGKTLKLTDIAPAELASPAYEIIVVLNFMTIIAAHFLYYNALSKNILEKEALNRQLQVAVQEANRAARSKADFLSTMSHELRTPLNSVIGMTQLLLQAPYNIEQAENLKIVNFSALNLHMLINDILDFNKLELDKLKLEEINVDLYELVNDISSGMRFQAKEKGLELIVDIEDLSKYNQVITDPTRLIQIINNLLGNAIKFTLEGAVSFVIKINSVNDDFVDVKFQISDTGIGISPDKQDEIFEAFTQASSSTTRNFGGTGLGLAIVKRLLVLFESDIHLESNIGAGSVFTFNIVFKRGQVKQGIPTVEGVKEFDLNGLKVLVVEDNPINSLLLKKIFSNWNSQPDFAVNGYEAIEKHQSSKFDVILMDIHMPLLDGYETAKLIREMEDVQKSQIPIIALTASVSVDLEAKIQKAGMNDYVNKPFNSNDLYGKLKRIPVKSSSTLENFNS